MASTFRPPYIVRIVKRSATAAQTQGPANRLALTSASVAAPFSQPDWTNPQRRLYPVALRTHINPFPLLLYGQDQFFAAPGMGPDYDYPNPRRPIRLNVGFTVNILPVLYGQDVFFGPPGYGPDYDYPNPVLKPRQRLGMTQNALALTAAAPAASPFAAQDFPNPGRRRAAQPQLAGRTLDPQAPFSAATFDNPRRPRRAPFDLTSPNLVLYAVFPVPFHQADWPNPRRRFFHFGVPWAASPAVAEIPDSDFWTPVTPASGAWSAVSTQSAAWTPVAPTPKTWTPT